MLYAWITSILILNTPVVTSEKTIVKILKWWSQLAGNAFNFVKLGTSETLRNEIVERDKTVSEHVPKHLRPLNNDQFGHYLAGLIDGDGHFSSKQQLVIVFDSLSAPLAYYLKTRIGHGNVRKIKNKNAFLFIISSFEGMKVIIDLVNNRMRGIDRVHQIEKNILSHTKYAELRNNFYFNRNVTKDLTNHWLAGFSDADGSFQIKILNRNNKKREVRLNYQVDQKRNDLSILIKDYMGGNIGYRSTQDIYYYGSTSFKSAINVINYFDNFHMMSNKHVNYLKWRKAFLLIQSKQHLTEKGLDKIIKLKSTMNRLNQTTI